MFTDAGRRDADRENGTLVDWMAKGTERMGGLDPFIDRMCAVRMVEPSPERHRMSFEGCVKLPTRVSVCLFTQRMSFCGRVFAVERRALRSPETAHRISFDVGAVRENKSHGVIFQMPISHQCKFSSPACSHSQDHKHLIINKQVSEEILIPRCNHETRSFKLQ